MIFKCLNYKKISEIYLIFQCIRSIIRIRGCLSLNIVKCCYIQIIIIKENYLIRIYSISNYVNNLPRCSLTPFMLCNKVNLSVCLWPAGRHFFQNFLQVSEIMCVFGKHFLWDSLCHSKDYITIVYSPLTEVWGN